jgi:hypothetical protein
LSEAWEYEIKALYIIATKKNIAIHTKKMKMEKSEFLALSDRIKEPP